MIHTFDTNIAVVGIKENAFIETSNPIYSNGEMETTKRGKELKCKI